jgi:hypothetical protein
MSCEVKSKSSFDGKIRYIAVFKLSPFIQDTLFLILIKFNFMSQRQLLI